MLFNPIINLYSRIICRYYVNVWWFTMLWPGLTEKWLKSVITDKYCGFRSHKPYWSLMRITLGWPVLPVHAHISYLPMWIQAEHTFVKTVYSKLSYGRQYAGKNMPMFALVFCLELSACAARTHLAMKNLIHDGKWGQLKMPGSHER